MKQNLCDICPRQCNINREKYRGFCGQDKNIYISKVMLHKFEEPCISGNQPCADNNPGSGAIFFSGCNLRCIYCQNYNISQQQNGKLVTTQGLISIFKQLEKAGALNINLVTPTHYTKQIIEALRIYKPQIPVIWNSSGYEKPEIIEQLHGLVDIFLIDFKYFSSNLAEELSNAKDYPKYAKQTLLTIKDMEKSNVFDESGNMKQGLIIRHLCLPNCVNDTLDIIDWIYKNLGNNTTISLMSQYVPMHNAINNSKINRKLKPIEYKIAVNKITKLGFKNAYIQELSSSSAIYTPNFDDNSSDFDY